MDERCAKCDSLDVTYRCPICDTVYCDFCCENLDGICPDCGEELELIDKN